MNFEDTVKISSVYADGGKGEVTISFNVDQIVEDAIEDRLQEMSDGDWMDELNMTGDDVFDHLVEEFGNFEDITNDTSLAFMLEQSDDSFIRRTMHLLANCTRKKMLAALLEKEAEEAA